MQNEGPKGSGRSALSTLAGLPAAGAAALFGAQWRALGGVRRRAEEASLDGVDALLASRFAEELVERIADGPGMERLVDRVVESKAFHQAVVRLLESDELWLLVDEVAQSPAVLDAVSQQGKGFADQVAADVRARSRNADDWLERRAFRVMRRRGAPPEAG